MKEKSPAFVLGLTRPEASKRSEVSDRKCEVFSEDTCSG
uniref:Uncharacterized protein n=1 Tax=Tetraselmis sp. GSL018 TaxID=582737 RepID=A0A061RVX2_9CHLO